MENKIKEIIKKKKLKTKDILSVTGLSKSYFYDVANSNCIPSLANARKIANAIGVELQDIFPEQKEA